MMPLSYDARRHARVMARFRVDYRFGDASGEGWSNNLSEGGIYLHAKRPLPVDSPVSLSLHLENQAFLQLSGRVVRVAEDDGGTAIGIAFDPPDAPTRLALAELVRTLSVKPNAKRTAARVIAAAVALAAIGYVLTQIAGSIG